MTTRTHNYVPPPLRTLRALGLLLATAALSACGASEPERALVEPASAEPGLICNGPGCSCGPTFGIGMVQSTWGGGANGNFEVVTPHAGGGMSHYHRDNGTTQWSMPWYGPTLFAGSADVSGVSLIQSNFGQGNLEVVATVGGNLVHYNRDDGVTWAWSAPTTIATGVRGQPGVVQSNHGTKGNFEVVVPLATGGLAHYYRDNDTSGLPWSGATVFGTGRVYDAVALIQSNYGAGHLEVIARSGAFLWFFFRDDGGTGLWNGPSLVSVNGSPIQATGTFGLIQSNHGTQGNFELIVPLASGGLAHYVRDNDTSGIPWLGPTVVLDPSSSYSAAAVIQSTYGGGHLEVVARRNDSLVSAWRDDYGTGQWSPRYAFSSEPCCDPSTKGTWADPISPNTVGIHTALMPNGKVLMFGFTDTDAQAGQSTLLNPGTGAEEATSYPGLMHHPHLFCSGHTLLPDGRLWVAGGHHHDVDASHTFDASTKAWTMHAPMSQGRWYPTTTVLPDGRVIVFSGSKNGGPINSAADVNNTYQFFNPATNTLTAPNANIPSPFSTDGFTAIDLYPYVYPLPNGKLFVFSRQTSRLFNPNTGVWDAPMPTSYPYSRTYPAEGSSVLLTLSPSDGYTPRVLVLGGAGQPLGQDTPATATVELLDLGAASPAWQNVAPMSQPRVLMDAVVLPDGKVFAVGGSSTGKADLGTQPVLMPELYNPANDTWTPLCPMRAPRLYHSTALLLPDGRVMLAGRDGQFNASPYKWPEHRVEFYSPPYLAVGPRPVITLAPPTLTYNANFNVSLGSAVPGTSISRAVLIRLGSVTHGFNMNQRAVQLNIVSASASALTLQAPPSTLVAPPGHYMLFLLSNQGVPSVAPIVKL